MMNHYPKISEPELTFRQLHKNTQNLTQTDPVNVRVLEVFGKVSTYTLMSINHRKAVPLWREVPQRQKFPSQLMQVSNLTNIQTVPTSSKTNFSNADPCGASGLMRCTAWYQLHLQRTNRCGVVHGNHPSTGPIIHRYPNVAFSRRDLLSACSKDAYSCS
jgi:hypothetical protein